MDLRQLGHFVATAELLHFGRAALRLGLTQPSLSQSIQRLEKSMGVALLARTRRGVSLTDAGQILLGEARELLARAELAKRMTLRAASEPRELHIGFVPSALYRVLPPALVQFRQRWPGVEFRMTELPSGEQFARLRGGALDFGFVVLGDTKAEDLAVRIIETSPLCVAVPSRSPFARRASIRLAELANEAFILADRETNPAVHALVTAACRSAGFEPRVVQHSSHTFTTLKLVASGIAMALVPALAETLKIDGVGFIRLAGRKLPAPLKLAVAWMDRPLAPPSQAFVTLIEEIAGRTGARVMRKKSR